MQRTSIFLVALAFAAQAYATGGSTPPATQATVSGTATNTVKTSTAASSYVLGAGSSKSTATNTQAATASFGGSGSITSGPASQVVTDPNCLPGTTVTGAMTKGSVAATGSVTATGSGTASNVSTGTGVGQAQAVGSSYAEVQANAAVSGKGFDLKAGGDAFAGVLTDTKVVGTNGAGSSSGAIGSTFTSKVNGSLFQYATGDVKNVTSSTVTNVGGLQTSTSNCKTTTCIGGNAQVNNATVEGGANGTTTGTVTATITKP